MPGHAAKLLRLPGVASPSMLPRRDREWLSPALSVGADVACGPEPWAGSRPARISACGPGQVGDLPHGQEAILKVTRNRFRSLTMDFSMRLRVWRGVSGRRDQFRRRWRTLSLSHLIWLGLSSVTRTPRARSPWPDWSGSMWGIGGNCSRRSAHAGAGCPAWWVESPGAAATLDSAVHL